MLLYIPTWAEHQMGTNSINAISNQFPYDIDDMHIFSLICSSRWKEIDNYIQISFEIHKFLIRTETLIKKFKTNYNKENPQKLQQYKIPNKTTH